MLSRLKGIAKDESGQILPIFAVMLVVLLGFAALAIDSGGMYYMKNEAYNIAEASALSTMEHLNTDTAESEVIALAMKYALSNGAKEEDVSISTNYTVADDGLSKLNEVTVKISKKHNMIFGNLISDNDGVLVGQYTLSADERVYSPFTAYTPEEINDLVVNEGYIPIASASELFNL